MKNQISDSNIELLIEDHFSSGFKLMMIRLMGMLFVTLNLTSFASQTTVERQFSNGQISTAKVIYVSKIGGNSNGSSWSKAYNTIQGGNYGFEVFSRIKIKNCRLIVTNFSQPVGKPSTGIINVKEKGEFLHIDFENCSLMGYKVFGVGDDQNKSNIPYSIKGRVCAYIQYQQAIPEGMERIGNWPVEVFNSISQFRIRNVKK